MQNPRNAVATILYGAGSRRRFTQDGPVLPDVWAEYLNYPDDRLALLIEPWLRRTPFEVSSEIRDAFGKKMPDDVKLVYNRTTISCALTIKEVITHIIPLTGWYTRTLTSAETKKKKSAALALPKIESMWEDVIRPAKPTYPHPELLAFIRIVGVIGFLAHNSDRSAREEEIRKLLEKIREPDDDEEADAARTVLAEKMIEGWGKLNLDLPPPGTHEIIHSINRNRPAFLALDYSVKTVKGDAAKQLFSVACKDLTWAIIDCGIDATHPAFLDRSVDGPVPTSVIEKLGQSRVKQTYDFTILEDLLRGKTPKNLSSQQKKRLNPDKLQEIDQRIQSSQLIDWELLRPYLEIRHDEAYPKNRPVDSHGTHVAGILGANWPGKKRSLYGMCPDIKLIDIRVCRPDGSSDEFIIMSALQFLRYLNSNTERPSVHGANLSLSIPHDVATYACGQTPICVEAERVVSSGIVVVAAAGNFGYRRIAGENSDTIEQYSSVSITDPGNAERVITVGSTHRMEPHTYGVSYFSSRGPTGDGRIKPDLLAPGEKILAPALDDSTARLDGTSMAAPHVSGAAAMLMARHVELQGDPDRIKSILCQTATNLGRERYFQGHGLVDVLRAIQSV